LASSPTPETQVRVACACAGVIAAPATNSAPNSHESRVTLVELDIVIAPPTQVLMKLNISTTCRRIVQGRSRPDNLFKRANDL
jgi:hypothetical protein